MAIGSINADEELAQLCQELRLLREQAGGPSVRRLADAVGLGKSQVGAILGGGIRRPPEWDVVRGMVEAVYKYAHDHGREQDLSVRAGLDEYWRPRYSVVEHAFDRGMRGGRDRTVAPRAEAVVPRQLPPVAPHFAGRLAEMNALSAPVRGPLLITGMAGVGKTTLAVAWAHQVADQFPDGQLYVNLRGFDPSGQPMTPAQAVRALLDGLSPAPHHFPPGFEAQVGLYRSLLSHKRMLVVLDNARDADQIRDLLPGAAGCRVVVTSRVELTGLIATDGAFPVRLEVLSRHEARQMLANRLGRQRAGAEPEAIDRLMAACGRLPIALAIVAARAASRPDFALSAIADETDRARGGLSAFHLDDPGADARAIFSWSYQALSAPAAHLLCLFGLVSFPDIGIHAVVSLAAISEERAALLLAELCRAHLIAEVTPGRYVLHDLLRAFAAELADATPDPALSRYLDHHVHTAYAAALLVRLHRAPIELDLMGAGVAPQSLSGRADAMRWFAVESQAVLAAAAQAAEGGHDSRVWQLAWAVADFYELLGGFDEWVALQELAIAAARRSNGGEIYGRMLLIGGNARLHAADLDGALRYFEAARAVFDHIGHIAWLARAEIDIGSVMERRGQYAQALVHTRRSLEIYRAAGDLSGQARARNAVGWCYCLVGRHELAIDECRLALAHYQNIGDAAGAAATWDSLGYAHQGLRQHTQAVDCYRQALHLIRAGGDRYNEAGVLMRLGDTHIDAGDETAAHESWRQALTIFEDLDQPDAAQMRQRLGIA